MPHREHICPICRRRARFEQDGDRQRFQCTLCGKFVVTGTALSTVFGNLSETQAELLPYLSAYIRQQNIAGAIVEITEYSDWERLAYSHRGTPVQRRQIRLLEEIGASNHIPGRFVPLNPESAAPLIDACDAVEVLFHLNALVKSALLECRRPGESEPSPVPAYPDQMLEVRITPEGWQVLQPMGGFQPGSCFVAMAFAPELDPAFSDAIEPAVRDCGFQAIRVDRLQHNDSITDQIIVGIRTAPSGIADVTLQRNGVYFEGGYAMGLGRPVIWMVRKTDSKNIHFDTSHLSHVVWEDENDLRRKLTDRIRGTIPGAKLSGTLT